jgi:hypothetical protein
MPTNWYYEPEAISGLIGDVVRETFLDHTAAGVSGAKTLVSRGEPMRPDAIRRYMNSRARPDILAAIEEDQRRNDVADAKASAQVLMVAVIYLRAQLPLPPHSCMREPPGAKSAALWMSLPKTKSSGTSWAPRLGPTTWPT